MTINNPSYHSLRQFTQEMPNACLTDWDNFNIITQIKTRSPHSTFIVGNSPSSLPNFGQNRYEQFARLQESYVQENGLIRIDGSIGISPQIQANVSLFIEKSYPNIAAMQKQLFFPPKENFKIIYTPKYARR